VFEPTVTNNITNSGENVKETLRLLPGYVFAYSEDIISISDWDKILKTSGIIKPLGKESAQYDIEKDEQGNSQSIDYSLKDKGDSDFAKLLYGLGGRLNQVHLKDDGSHCTLADNVWSDDIEATIVKVDRRKKRAKIMFMFEGRHFTT
jgi:transcription antitermination factor NusG